MEGTAMSRWEDEPWTVVYIVLGLVVLMVLGLVAIVQPHFEAGAYTRLTGKTVTYWDAVWLDLRIQEQVR